MKFFETLNLQLFAESGSVVNTTTGTANAHTGATTTTNALSVTMKAYYDTELLENARTERVYAQFGKTQPLPRNNGKSVEWRKPNTFKKAEKLVEGVIPNGQTYGMTSISASIDEYGTFAAVSDVLEYTAYDNVILNCTEEMGASAARSQEELIRDSLLVNNNVFYCDNINIADGKFVSTPNSPNQMEASETTMSVLTPRMIAMIVTEMKKDKVPTINGKYVAVIHPSVAFMLREDPAWIEAHKYAATDEIFNGEIGTLHNVRFIENADAPVLRGDYANKLGTSTYATYFFGKDSFGIIDLEGGALEMLVKDKSEVGGPLEQYSTIGYKFFSAGATILYPERVVRAMSCSTYSDVDDANNVEEE